ncbi:unnamed protein product [Ixodes pacificus]
MTVCTHPTQPSSCLQVLVSRSTATRECMALSYIHY